MIYKTAAEAINSGVPGAKTIQGALWEAKRLQGVCTLDVEGRPARFAPPINEVPQTDPENPNGIWHVAVSALQGVQPVVHSPTYNPYYVDEDDNTACVRGGSVNDPVHGPGTPCWAEYGQGIQYDGRHGVKHAQDLCDKLNAAYHRDKGDHVWGRR